jgi:hypothetical protein
MLRARRYEGTFWSAAVASKTFGVKISVSNQGTLPGKIGTIKFWSVPFGTPFVPSCNATAELSTTVKGDTLAPLGKFKAFTIKGIPAPATPGKKTLVGFVDGGGCVQVRQGAEPWIRGLPHACLAGRKRVCGCGADDGRAGGATELVGHKRNAPVVGTGQRLTPASMRDVCSCEDSRWSAMANRPRPGPNYVPHKSRRSPHHQRAWAARLSARAA